METQMSAPVGVASRRLSFDTAAVWALSLTGALAVIAFIPTSSVSFIYTKVFILTLGAIVSLALYILARLSRGNIILPPLLFLGALWLVPLAYILSTIFSGNPLAASFGGTQLESDTSGFILVIAILATLAALVFRRSEHYRTFFRVAVVSYVLILAFQFFCIISSQFFPNSIAATTNFVGSLLDMGMLVGAGIVLSLVTLRLTSVGRKMTIVLYIGIVLGVFLLALVNSSLIWGLVGLAAFAFFVESITRRSMKNAAAGTNDDVAIDSGLPMHNDHTARTLIPSLIVLVVSVFLIIGSSTIGQSFATTLGVSFVDVRPSWQATFDVARQTYTTSPLFGSGPGTFATEWLQHRDKGINETVFWNVDFTSGIGAVPSSFVTTGIVGAIAWIVFLLGFLILGVRFLLFRAPSDEYLRFVAITSFTASVYLLAVAVFLVPGPAVLAVTFLTVGVFISTARFAGERRESSIIFARNPALGFVIVFVLTVLLLASIGGAYLVVERYFADVSFNKAAQAYVDGNTEAVYAGAKRSALFAESDRVYRLTAETAIVEMRGIANNTALSADAAKSAFQNALSRGIDAALTATRLAPNDYRNWITLGSVYQAVVPLGIQGAYTNAKAAYEHAVTLHPTSPILPLTLAQLEISNKNYADAEKYLQQSIALKNNYTQAIFLYSQLQASQGKTKEALASAAAAAYFAPNDPTILFQVGILSSASGDNQMAIAALTRATELNPQYANAFFFLGVSYAITKDLPKALLALQAAAALSPDNAKALESDIAALSAGKNPFPPSRLGALGIAQAPVEDREPATPVKAESVTPKKP